MYSSKIVTIDKIYGKTLYYKQKVYIPLDFFTYLCGSLLNKGVHTHDRLMNYRLYLSSREECSSSYACEGKLKCFFC